jgi:multiple sugar transport system permease protein
VNKPYVEPHFGRFRFNYNRQRLSELSLLLFMLPAMIVIMTFVVVPAVWAIYVSFTNQSLIGPTAHHFSFIGIDNYKRLFEDESFWSSLRITVLFVFGSAFIGQFVLGLTLAVLLRRKGFYGKTLVSASVLIAWVIPEIVAAYIWSSLLNTRLGTLNELFENFGWERRRWLIDYPLQAIIIANIWRGTAFSMLLFSSAIETIPQDIYDAAEVDGASGWGKFWYITLALIRYTVLLDFILITMGTFAVFGMVFALTNGGPLFRSEVISIYIYRNAFQYYEIGYGSAASVIVLAINLVLAFVYLRSLRVEW